MFKAFMPSRKLLWQVSGKSLSGLSTPGGRHDKNNGLGGVAGARV
jgi:hypothetical protein